MADRIWRYTLGAIALSLFFLVTSGAADAALITVDNLSSGSVAGHCTLSDAVASANSHSTVGSSDCTAGTGNDTIEFSVSGTITVTATLLITDAVLEIEGPTTAPGVQINGDAAGIFAEQNTTFILNNLTLMNGDLVFGGAIYATSGDLQINNCLFTDNSGTDGGAIFAENSSAEIINTTFGYNDASNLGGAIFNDTATMYLTNDTFVGNDALGTAPAGGALYSNSPTHSKAVIFKLGAVGSNCGYFSAGDAIDAGYNLSQDASCNLTSGTSLSSTAPGLNGSGLANNGGPTQTVALIPSSAAIGLDLNCTDQASNPVLTDQRLYGRPNSPTFCDSGAFEHDGVQGSFGFTPSSERMQVARSTNPNSDELNLTVTFSETGSACNSQQDALNDGVDVLVYPGTCEDYVAETEVLDADLSFIVHDINHQFYGTFTGEMPDVSAKLVTIQPQSGDFCGEWSLNLESFGLDTASLDNGPIALVLTTPDTVVTGCLDITNAIIGYQIPSPVIPVVRRGARR